MQYLNNRRIEATSALHQVKLSLSINISLKIVPLDPLNVHFISFCIVRMSSLLEKLTLEKEEAVSELNFIIVTGLLRKYVICCCLALGLEKPHL